MDFDPKKECIPEKFRALKLASVIESAIVYQDL